MNKQEFYKKLCEVYIKLVEEKSEVQYIDKISKMIFHLQESIDDYDRFKYKYDKWMRLLDPLITWTINKRIGDLK